MLKTSGIVCSTRRWIYLSCDEELGNYYRSLAKAYLLNLKCDYNNKMWPKLHQPTWRTHLSIVRLEDFESLSRETIFQYWNKWDGQEVEIEYMPGILSNGLYFWLSVKDNEQLSQIRLTLGLSKNPSYAYHITIGNLVE